MKQQDLFELPAPKTTTKKPAAKTAVVLPYHIDAMLQVCETSGGRIGAEKNRLLLSLIIKSASRILAT